MRHCTPTSPSLRTFKPCGTGLKLSPLVRVDISGALLALCQLPIRSRTQRDPKSIETAGSLALVLECDRTDENVSRNAVSCLHPLSQSASSFNRPAANQG